MLPSLSNWQTNRNHLQQAALAMSTIAKHGRTRDEVFHHHLSLAVASAQTLTTGETHFGVFDLSFDPPQVIYHTNGKRHKFDLVGTQAELAQALMAAVNAQGFALDADLSDVSHTEPMTIDRETAANYGAILHTVVRALQVQQSMLSEESTALVVFPHHFDASFIWFNGTPQSESDSHVMFGFSPGDSSFPMPYVYAYAWDAAAETYLDLAVSSPWEKHEQWQNGVIIGFESLQQTPDLKGLIATAVRQIKDAAQILWE